MLKVTLVGTGNVSHHLKQVLSQSNEIELVEILRSRGPVLTDSQKSTVNPKQKSPNIYIIAVSDDAIPSVAKKLIGTNALVVHTSGSVSLAALPPEIRRGVFYPLQTFSKDSTLNFKEVPLCIEAENEEDYMILRTLSGKLSDSVYDISSEQRAHLHLAAVFVNNFVNHLYHIGQELCTAHQVPFAILKPLIKETAKKIAQMSPNEAQTGPARRNDHQTITRHLAQIKSKKQKEIYELITKSIQDTYAH